MSRYEVAVVVWEAMTPFLGWVRPWAFDVPDTVEGLEALIRRHADEAEGVMLERSYIVSYALHERFVVDDYMRIRRGVQGDAFEIEDDAAQAVPA
jgi:hypothetical protein